MQPFQFNSAFVVIAVFLPYSYCQGESENSKQTSLVPDLTQAPPGIKCYVCNSARDPRCGDPFNPQTIELVDCNQFSPGMNATVCRKNVQKVSLGERVDMRVVRSCGYLPENKPSEAAIALAADTGDNADESGDKNSQVTPEGRCYTRAGTFEVMVTYCTCNQPGCNGADHNIQQNSVIIILSTLLLGIFSYLLV